MGKGKKGKYSLSSAQKVANEDERALRLCESQNEVAAREAAEERMKASAFHPSEYKRGRWLCCGYEDETLPGCYTYDDSDGRLISFPLKVKHGRYQ